MLGYLFGMKSTLKQTYKTPTDSIERVNSISILRISRRYQIQFRLADRLAPTS